MRLFLPLVLLLQLGAPQLFAQDTMHVFLGKGAWNLHHRVKKGETIFQLARRYKAPPAAVAETNGLTYKDQLREGSTVVIPLGSYNQLSAPPARRGGAKALVYVTREGDDLYAISRRASVPQKTLQQWNRLRDSPLGLGRRLFVGWVAYDTVSGAAKSPAVTAAPAQPTPSPKYSYGPVTTPAVRTDTVGRLALTGVAPDSDSSNVTLSPAEAEFRRQTDDGRNIVTEKGTAVLFNSSATAANGLYNGFFNGVQRGAVVEVRNLNNGRSIYVKVLGPLPANKLYFNASMGISSAARGELGITDERTFCQFRYAGY